MQQQSNGSRRQLPRTCATACLLIGRLMIDAGLHVMPIFAKDPAYQDLDLASADDRSGQQVSRTFLLTLPQRQRRHHHNSCTSASTPEPACRAHRFRTPARRSAGLVNHRPRIPECGLRLPIEGSASGNPRAIRLHNKRPRTASATSSRVRSCTVRRWPRRVNYHEWPSLCIYPTEPCGPARLLVEIQSTRAVVSGQCQGSVFQ